MATFVILVNLTDKGASAIKDGPKRIQELGSLVSKLGASVKDFYVTMGEYDYVAIGEGPDDETCLAVCAALATDGNVRTTSMRAFTLAEFAPILGRLG